MEISKYCCNYLNLYIWDHELYLINQSKFDLLLMKALGVVVVADPNHQNLFYSSIFSLSFFIFCTRSVQKDLKLQKGVKAFY